MPRPWPRPISSKFFPVQPTGSAYLSSRVGGAGPRRKDEVVLHVVVRNPNGRAQKMLRRVRRLHAFVHEVEACTPAREPHDLVVQHLELRRASPFFTVDGKQRLGDAPELRYVVSDCVRRHLDEGIEVDRHVH